MKVALLVRLLASGLVVASVLALGLWAFQEQLVFTHEEIMPPPRESRKTLVRVPMTKEIEREKAFQLYTLWKDVSHADPEPINDESSETPLIVFIIPGHGQTTSDYQKLLSTMGQEFAGKQAEFYLFDFLE